MKFQTTTPINQPYLSSVTVLKLLIFKAGS